MSDEVLEQALDELGDVVRCHCDEAFRDRGLQDPECNCDSMDAVRVVLARIAWLERELSLADDQRREWEHHCKTAEATVATLTAQVEAMRGALKNIDALDPEKHIDGCSVNVLRGLVLRMGEIARAALTTENQTNG